MACPLLCRRLGPNCRWPRRRAGRCRSWPSSLLPLGLCKGRWRRICRACCRPRVRPRPRRSPLRRWSGPAQVGARIVEFGLLRSFHPLALGADCCGAAPHRRRVPCRVRRSRDHRVRAIARRRQRHDHDRQGHLATGVVRAPRIRAAQRAAVGAGAGASVGSTVSIWLAARPGWGRGGVVVSGALLCRPRVAVPAVPARLCRYPSLIGSRLNREIPQHPLSSTRAHLLPRQKGSTEGAREFDADTGCNMRLRAAYRDQPRRTVNWFFAVIPAAIVLIVAVGMGIGAALLGCPFWAVSLIAVFGAAGAIVAIRALG
jgi:hypothetical protein